MSKTSGKKKTTARKSAGSAKTAPAQGSKRQVVTKQPQQKQKAAVQSGMFLYTDDAWSLRYFDQNDLHCKEREVFG
jgi:hypothetical protein